MCTTQRGIQNFKKRATLLYTARQKYHPQKGETVWVERAGALCPMMGRLEAVWVPAVGAPQGCRRGYLRQK